VRHCWLDAKLAAFAGLKAVDVQTTLTALTAQCCADSVLNYGNMSKELIVCGGGALNGHLMQELQARLPKIAVSSSAAAGMAPLQVEAAAFAWLARKTIHRETSNLPNVTGARGARILGAIYPA
jgi:anhydro-N-acetylmuramic acid kinase